MSGNYSNINVDLTTFFTPYTSGTKVVTNYQVNGNDIGNTFQPYNYGPMAQSTNYLSNNADLNTLFQNINVVNSYTGSGLLLENSQYTVLQFVASGFVSFQYDQPVNYGLVGGGDGGDGGDGGNKYGGNGGNGGRVNIGTTNLLAGQNIITIGGGGNSGLSGLGGPGGNTSLNSISTNSSGLSALGGPGGTTIYTFPDEFEGVAGTTLNIGNATYYLAGGGGGGISGDSAYIPAPNTNINYGVGYGGGAVAKGNANNSGIENTGGGGSGGGVYGGDSGAAGGHGGSGVAYIWF